MTHFGIISHVGHSHVACLASVGRELQRRNHQVTFFNILDNKQKVLAEGIDFQSIGNSDRPLGWLPQYRVQLFEQKGISGICFTIKTAIDEAAMVFRDAPNAIKKEGVEVLLVDQYMPAGGLVAEYLDIPFITICNGLPLNREAGVPPISASWGYKEKWWAYLRNQAMYSCVDLFSQPIASFYQRQRQKWNLPPARIVDDNFSRLAQIGQLTAELDFPRKNLPACFHYVGRLRSSSPQAIPFPFERLTDQPLIYASLGTVWGDRYDILHYIAAACNDIEAQLVISLGGTGHIEELEELPGSPLVVEFAPQLELLARATLTITHAGLNTTLESLSYGVPMVAIPITHDQMGIGARLCWTGAGEVISPKALSISKLQDKIQRVLTDSTYRTNAARLKKSIEQAGGVVRAVDIIEQVMANDRLSTQLCK